MKECWSTNQAGFALLVSDRRPSAELVGTLVERGYEIENMYSIDRAALSLSRRVPDFVVAGPFRSTCGLDFLLLQLQRLRVRTLLLSEDAGIIQLAERLGIRVQAPGLAIVG